MHLHRRMQQQQQRALPGAHLDVAAPSAFQRRLRERASILSRAQHSETHPLAAQSRGCRGQKVDVGHYYAEGVGIGTS
jgi:hypothetical protein